MVLFLFSSTPNIQIRILLQGSLKLFAGIIMIIMGVNMLGIFQGLRGCLKNQTTRIFLQTVVNAVLKASKSKGFLRFPLCIRKAENARSL